MGTYLNPGNSGFTEVRQSEYVDKTGLIHLINDTIGTLKKLTCISRPRRFGKSIAAKMLCAYYDKSCDSHSLFDDLDIAKTTSYEQHLNQYDVIYIDMTYVKQFSNDYANVTKYLPEKITEELCLAYPDLSVSNEFPATLMNVTSITGN